MDFHIIDEGMGPAILFIHAGVADSRMWDDQIPLVNYRTIAYDQRGFGQSAFVAEPYTDRGDAIAVLDQVGIEKATIVGCSIGAGTAMQLAIEDPERVDKLVLVGAYPSGWIPPDGWEESELEAEAEKASEAGDLDRILEIDYLMWVVGYGREEVEIPPAHKELFLEMDRTPVQTESERMEHIRHRDYQLNDRLDEIEAPTLVISGAHDEKLSVDASHYLAERLSDRRAVIIPGAAHLPSMEQPEAFNTALIEFLEN